MEQEFIDYKYWTLRDIFVYKGYITEDQYSPAVMAAQYDDFAELLMANGCPEAKDDLIERLMRYYIIPKTFNTKVLVTVEDEPENDLRYYVWLGKLASWLTSSLARYTVLFKGYDKYSIDELLGPISTKTTTNNKQADLAQTDYDATWDGKDQLSSVNASEVNTESDSGTVLSRLEEVRRKYKDIYSVWLKEYEERFDYGC